MERTSRDGVESCSPESSAAYLDDHDLSVLWHVGMGYSDAEIARSMGRSSRTVRYWLRRISALTGVRGRVRLAMLAVRAGVLTPDEALGVGRGKT